MTAPLPAEDKEKELRFVQASTQTVALIPKKPETFLDESRARVAGVSRLFSHGMVITSGMGVGATASPMRVATGLLGMSASVYLALFGKKLSPEEKETSEGRKVVENASFIYMASGLTLLVSGLLSKRPMEAFAGAWTASAFAIQRFLPEGKKPEQSVQFDNAGHAHTVGVTGQGRSYVQDLLAHPVRLGSDMLQLSAFLVLADGISNRDKARTISGLCLGVSNLMLRGVRKDDFHGAAMPGAGRGI
jgi:hypothetical protein